MKKLTSFCGTSLRAGMGLWIGLIFAQPSPGSAQTVLSNEVYEVSSLSGVNVQMNGKSELHVTGSGTPITGSIISMNSIDSWTFVHQISPSTIISSYLGQFRVNGANAINNSNVRVVQHGQGAVIIPYPNGFQPLEVFDGANFSGDSMLLSPNTSYGSVLGGKVSSFVLKRGYTATLAQYSNGTGVSVNYVASDGDLRIGALPEGLNDQVRFVRVYPWHWVTKKGSCDIAPSALNAKWYYNWSLTWQEANPNYEYVAIKQQRWWPVLPNPVDAGYLGINHVSGYNEPDNPVEDAYTSLNNGDVATAVGAWGDLEWTGLRIGAPAVTDGGRNWILDFMSQAEAAGRRVDYVPIHYYRSSNNDPASAANALYSFLKDIYNNTQRPIWLTEFNNGANWTGGADPTFVQNRDCIEAMINMMDSVPWIERYSVYSAVEEVRQVYYNGGGYTPMGAMYRDHVAPLSYLQIIPGEGMHPSAQYDFENNLDDSSGSGNHAVSKNYPDFVAGHGGGTAIQFDGTDDHVILSDSLSDGTDFTFAAWIYWGGGSNWQRIFDFGILDSNTGSNGKYMFMTPNSGSGLKFAITTSGYNNEQTLVSASALPQNTWTHVAVTLSGNTGRLYVNGSQVAVNSSMSINPVDLGAIHHYLGRSMFLSDAYFNGRMDDVIIRDQALTGTQIAGLASNQAPVVYADLVDGGTITKDEVYSGSVAGAASDPEGGSVTYSKLYGPAWLNVAGDGALSGTPTGNLTGDQLFTIRATDSVGEAAYFVLRLELFVVPSDFTAGPIAYWDFNDAGLGATEGAALPDSDGSTVWRLAATDKSGNGNGLTTWDHDWAGFDWRSYSQQGDFSMKAAGTYPAAFTWSDQSVPDGINAETVVLTNFTVEALATTSGSGFRTLVGRDARYVATGSDSHAAFYLGLNTENHPRVIMVDENGTLLELIASGVTVPNNESTWYHLAVVKKGDHLVLYVNGVMQAETTEVGLGALAIGSSSGEGWHAGGWSVGRGLWAGEHVDRWYGHIDAVAISGVALKPGSFVITGVWPKGYEFYFDKYGIPEEAFDGDADANGILNGVEYYLGSDPTNSASPESVLTLLPDYTGVTYPYNPTASGVTGVVEWTTDLMSSNWFDTGMVTLTNDLTNEIESWIPGLVTNQFFMRLNVEY